MKTISRFPKKVIFAGAIGGAIEFYDFTLYGVLATSFAPLFFPSNNHFLSMLNAYAVFAVGFFARPVGAILFGHVGDKFGRKTALFWSLSLMSIATLTIGILPTYSSIGIFAPILLLLSRLVQGISAGGEYSGALIFAIEHGDKKHSGFIGGSITMGCMSGLVLSSLVGFVCGLSEMPTWSWRMPFILGFLISIVGVYIRFRLDESPEFLQLKNNSLLLQSTITRDGLFSKKEWRDNFKTLLPVIFLAGFNGIVIYVYSVFLSTFVSEVTNVSLNIAKLYSCIGTAILMVMNITFGSLSDKLGRMPVILAGAVATTLSAIVLFYNLANMSSLVVFLCQCIFMVAVGMYSGPLNTFIIEIFRVGVRYRFAAFGYSVGMGIVGGTAPLVASLLSASHHNHLFLSLYFCIGGVLALLGLWMLKTNHQKMPLSKEENFVQAF